MRTRLPVSRSARMENCWLPPVSTARRGSTFWIFPTCSRSQRPGSRACSFRPSAKITFKPKPVRHSRDHVHVPRKKLSQITCPRRCSIVNAPSEAVAAFPAEESPFDFDATFRAQYPRIARVIARVVRDRARAEELAVEAFLKLWRNPQVHDSDSNVEAWLYRTAVRLGLDELRRQTRRARFEQWLRFARP